MPPANDNFADAITISGTSGSIAFNNADATREVDEPVPAGDAEHTVWFKWVAPTDCDYIVFHLNDSPSSVDTVLAFYTGTELADLVEFASDDDGGNDHFSLLELEQAFGETYWIQVGGYSEGEAGDLVLTWHVSENERPPAIETTTITFGPLDGGSTGSFQYSPYVADPIPAGVTEVTVRLYGAGSGDITHYPSHNNWAFGGYVEFTLPVSEGDVLTFIVGENPAQSEEEFTSLGVTGGYPDGGDAGYDDTPSHVRGAGGGGSTTLLLNGTPVGVAGGAGGFGYRTGFLDPTAGLGAGGDPDGYDGDGGALAAGGATQSTGGAAGVNDPGSFTEITAPTAGTFGQGGAGGSATQTAGGGGSGLDHGGAGGGGGYYGGGGGGAHTGSLGGLGGGGGSSWADDGLVTDITYDRGTTGHGFGSYRYELEIPCQHASTGRTAVGVIRWPST